MEAVTFMAHQNSEPESHRRIVAPMNLIGYLMAGLELKRREVIPGHTHRGVLLESSIQKMMVARD